MHLIRWAAGYLEERGVESPRLDAEYLLAGVLHMSRLDLYLHFDQPVAPGDLAAFRGPLVDRGERKPLQYSLGRTAFRELELLTDPRVLIPRPETEELVGAALDWVRGRPGIGGGGAAGAAAGDGGSLRALDVGTGSGAVAISLAVEGPFDGVVATDSSSAALEVARANAQRAGADGRVELRVGSIYEPVLFGECFDVVISNPPYVSEAEYDGLAPEVRGWEPRDALVAGDGGLRMLDALVDGAAAILAPGGLLALEVGLGQACHVAERICSASGLGAAQTLRDLNGRERMVLAVRESETA